MHSWKSESQILLVSERDAWINAVPILGHKTPS
ncbi:MAG: hypothetical protein CM15mP95_1670 [Alphaproteobacteria bacterium]|nr:MAG: hypothetical protein CM15mP95_1670 [Alphaproteobacteria bacterium]